MVPEAIVGGPIALVEDGDKIVIDAEKKTIDWLVDDEEQARRKAAWDATDKKQLKVKRGVLYRYARDVTVRSVHQMVYDDGIMMPVSVCRRWCLLRLKAV